MKKKIIIIVSTIFSFFVLCLVGLVIFYNLSLKAVDKNDIKDVTFVIESGTSSNVVVDQLYDNGLIRNKYVGYFYLKFYDDYVIQAGVYELKSGMNFKKIIEIWGTGKVVDDSISVTFIEGKRITNYIDVISNKFGYSEDEILEIISDKDYLKELIDKYWFLTEDILNDKLYYALEGYLAPNTYFFNKDDSISDIIEKLLDAREVQLNKYKDTILDSKYSIHELLTMASIVELEGANSDDRRGVAGVFYNRLNSGWSLGSDVTTYYAARVEMSERDLYQYELDDVNDYNTRVASMAGKLPVGPICNPGMDSVLAALEPESHDYYYFVADKNGKTYFTKTNNEHIAVINELKKNDLWYVYE